MKFGIRNTALIALLIISNQAFAAPFCQRINSVPVADLIRHLDDREQTLSNTIALEKELFADQSHVARMGENMNDVARLALGLDVAVGLTLGAGVIAGSTGTAAAPAVASVFGTQFTIAGALFATAAQALQEAIVETAFMMKVALTGVAVAGTSTVAWEVAMPTAESVSSSVTLSDDDLKTLVLDAISQLPQAEAKFNHVRDLVSSRSGGARRRLAENSTIWHLGTDGVQEAKLDAFETASHMKINQVEKALLRGFRSQILKICGAE